MNLETALYTHRLTGGYFVLEPTKLDPTALFYSMDEDGIVWYHGELEMRGEVPDYRPAKVGPLDYFDIRLRNKDYDGWAVVTRDREVIL